MKPDPKDKSAKQSAPKGAVRPADRTAADASPGELDAPEYYSKDRKPRVGTPDESPTRKG